MTQKLEGKRLKKAGLRYDSMQAGSMRTCMCFFALHLIALFYPLWQAKPTNVLGTHTVHWPESFQGRTLTRVGLTEQEQEFTAGFPGLMERFTDGDREIVMRHIVTPSRKVHPVSDCLKGAGFTVTPLPIVMDEENILWGCVAAVRGAERSKICERIYDNQGNSWTDASSWYWAAILGRTEGPWWAVVVEQSDVR